MNSCEKQLSARITAALRLRGWHVQKLEDRYSVGIPDLNVCKDGKELWVELKSFRWPVRKDTLVDLRIRRFQISWSRARVKAGGACLLMAQEAMTKEVYILDWADLLETDVRPDRIEKARLIRLGCGYQTIGGAADALGTR